MKKISVRKIYKGMCELTEHKVAECIKDNESIIVKYHSDIMILTPEDLVEKRIAVSGPQRVGEPNGGYRLYGYLWQPELLTNKN